MKPELVRFSSHPRPFHVKTIHCTNHECECTEVTFHFREQEENGESSAEALVFQVRLDGRTWEEIVPSDRSPEIARLVWEFLRDYSPGERDAIQEACREKSRIVQCLQECRIAPRLIEDGTLVAFGELSHDRADGKADGLSFLDIFQHDGEEYLVDDLYCPNPECDCRKVHLEFLRCVPSPGPGNRLVSELCFRASISLDGRAQIEECTRGTPGEARTALAAWQERYGDDLEQLRWRYRKVKEIARRNGPGRTRVSSQKNDPPEGLAPTTDRTGRNDPCPCGSGKKYKKCCRQKGITPRKR